MSFFTDFNSDIGNYHAEVVAPLVLLNFMGRGNPFPGCAKLHSEVHVPDLYPAYLINDVDTYVVQPDDHIFFNARFLCSGVELVFPNLIFGWFIGFADAASLSFHYYGPSLIPDLVDSGWLQFDIPLTSRVGKTMNYFHFGLPADGAAHNNQEGQVITAYIDSISIGTSAPPFDPNPPAPVGAILYWGVNGFQHSKPIVVG